MRDERTLRERFRAGEAIKTVRMPMRSSREEVQEAIRENACHMLYIDA